MIIWSSAMRTRPFAWFLLLKICLLSLLSLIELNSGCSSSPIPNKLLKSNALSRFSSWSLWSSIYCWISLGNYFFSSIYKSLISSSFTKSFTNPNSKTSSSSDEFLILLLNLLLSRFWPNPGDLHSDKFNSFWETWILKNLFPWFWLLDWTSNNLG